MADAPNIFSLPVALIPGTPLPSSDVQNISKSINMVGYILSETFGPGVLLSTDYNGSIIGGSLAVSLSSGRAVIGTAGNKLFVYDSGVLTLNQAAMASGTITPSTTNYFFKNRTGTFYVNQTGTPDANSILFLSAVMSATEATSINNLPVGRINLYPFLSDGKVYTSATDTISSFLADALVADPGLTIAEETVGGFGKRLRLTIGAPYSEKVDHIVKSVAGTGDITLVLAEYDGSILELTGILTGNRNVILPLTDGRRWIIHNNTTGNFALTIKGATGTGPIISRNAHQWVYTNATNFYIQGQAQILYGIAASLPNVLTTSPGTLYYATDTNVLYFSNGVAWTTSTAGGSGGAVVQYDMPNTDTVTIPAGYQMEVFDEYTIGGILVVAGKVKVS